ncbi:orotidine-5'-phosphate decarboxylase [Leucothrix arctica]|uniref:Orotidine 5'-phosphate decarboxylase n=1 Tax=Leucothrix arctica TaxID=1481894 RepID=A0A317C847_9GAMM|nr:orotidine-5'-phosphate decarboxylase [Leucothrix arctica]PWQ93543.1 orotidine-5'-phosphate decarboxylase [Leucothrix arctica]
MTFIEKLSCAWEKNNSLVCVGLDPDTERFPSSLRDVPDAIFQFNKAIIDATHDLVCAYKPQIAYFSAESAEDQLEKTIQYIQTEYPDIPVILDSKRGDIGSTAKKYAVEAFERYKADAVTINPYLGFDSAEPFLNYKDKGTVLLCRTSNRGANDLQDLDVGGMPLYQKVASMITEQWNFNKNCMLVVGATWPSQMSEVREIVGDMPFLVPGVGAQGGDIEALVKAGQTANGTGLIISSSRGVIYASEGDNFASAARSVVVDLREKINLHRN